LEIIKLSREKAKPSFKFREGRTPGKLIFTAKDLVIGYTEPLTHPLSIQLERGQKVAVKVNGLGKSTLLKAMMF
jgi:ATPase subunit of ABC transporter with duplicated ATPase domains